MSVVFVAGHNGMVGSAILRALKSHGHTEVVVAGRSELDLRDKAKVLEFLHDKKVDQIYLAAAKVGGILANNTLPADFIHENLEIQLSVIGSAYGAGVSRLLFLGSSCIYPKLTPQPITEDALLTGELEPTNEPYALAKIAGIKLCESFNRQYGTDFRSVMPTNLYGENDNFHPENSHVVAGLMRRFHEAKVNASDRIVVWGSGNPRREFLHVDDMARACLHVMNIEKSTMSELVPQASSHINVGTGRDCSIAELAITMADVVGFQGEVIFDSTKPDGTPRKLLDVSLLESTGWKSKIDLKQGLIDTYQWYVEAQEKRL